MTARDRIFARLQAVQVKSSFATPEPADWYASRARNESAGDRTHRFVSMMELARAEVHRVSEDNWVQKLWEILVAKKLGNLLLAPTTPHGARAQDRLRQECFACLAYDRPIEAWKASLFNEVQAGLTAARSAIAETGSLILWPDAREPRLMSLVPPVHFVLVDAKTIHPTLIDAMRAEGWANGLPSNALLISSPSKTADIQQTLAYGAHGPKELVVLLKEVV